MITLAHIINPVIAKPGSDLFLAQPVTFETMRAARNFSLGSIEVRQLTAQYPEDRAIVPQDFECTPDLERSILDIRRFPVQRKLPLMKDILDRLYYHSSSEYLLYSNVDIALQPYFYQTVLKITEQGYDAFVINRRTIPAKYQSLDQIPLMHAELGKKHPGWDCFVFKRTLYELFDLGTACIGTGWMGRLLIINMACLASQFRIFADLHLTFHVGNEQSWKSDVYNEYLIHNRDECRKVLTAFEQRFGKYDREKIPGRFFRLLEKHEGL